MSRLLLLLSLLVAGCCLGGGADSCAEACATEGECTPHASFEGVGCYAMSDAECAASAACRDEGRCSVAEDGVCVRPEEVEAHRCATSVGCRVNGACHAAAGSCVVQSEAECTASLGCLAQGRCRFDPITHFCHVADDAGCAASTGCALEGLCTYEPLSFIEGGGYGHCALTSAGHCEGTLACVRDGRCQVLEATDCNPPCDRYYCGRSGDRSAPTPCIDDLEDTTAACAPDGRCMRGDDGVCVHVL